MSSITFIVGPTATGKTKTAFELAKQTGADIISADSMLVYKEPRIITSKPDPSMLKEIRHHFIDIISVAETYDVFTYFTEVMVLTERLFIEKKPLIVCGGTGLYSRVLLDGIFKGPSRDEPLRAELALHAQAHGLAHLYEKLKTVDPEAAAKISPQDARRIIRALEVYYCAGVPLSKKQKERRGLWGNYPVTVFGLRMEREKLYERINARVDEMGDEGAVDEVRKLLDKDLSITAAKIIGIKEIKGYLDGEYSRERALELMKKNTRNFAKRQLTWFRKDTRINWIDVEDKNPGEIAECIRHAASDALP
jgi:tRNA dimethylallyltransferase